MLMNSFRSRHPGCEIGCARSWDSHVPRFTPGGKAVPRGMDVATFQELLALIAAGQGISPVAASVQRYTR
ncbi:hypothetical protein GCM10023205_18610 [Yinghuangia aomiensis]|uniref:Uncharacterized protein n=1 Tax=Yinghuangia aomiensis TaxID=676205 RepID=A0ABP9GZC7_9ACTN